MSTNEYRLELGREGSTVYFTDGTGYDRPDGGRAIQVWQQRPGEAPGRYCLLSGWEGSHAYRRIGRPETPVRGAASRAIFGARVL